jgi:hypothetical protein
MPRSNSADRLKPSIPRERRSPDIPSSTHNTISRAASRHLLNRIVSNTRYIDILPSGLAWPATL